MEFIIGLLIMLAGIGYAVYIFQKNTKKVAEIQFQQTSCIKDVLDIVGDLSSLDENYRHYSEVKGNLHSVTGDVEAPFSQRPVAYYENEMYSVHEETRTEKDDKGNTRTVTDKVETSLSREKSPVEIYLSDSSSEEKVYIDMESFGSDVDLMPGCNRFENEDSNWVKENFNFNSPKTRGSRFLGYRFFEEILPENQPMYILGEIHKRADRLYVGRAVTTKKSSHVTYKSEGELLDDIKNEKLIAMGIGAAGVVAGIAVMFLI